MKDLKLKKAMEHVNISEDMQKDIIQNMNRHIKGEKMTMIHWKKGMAAAAAALLVIGIISIPVQAGIRYLVKERMESLPQEEVQELSDMMEAQVPDQGNADSFSRNYTTEEKERMTELNRAYQKGTFPEGTLPTAATEEEAPEGEFCYVESTGRFLLPARELTDEELLEIIDFNCKRDYALSQDEDVKATKAAWEEEQKTQKALVESGGGISDSKALSIARTLLTTLFGESPDGMEENCYLDLDYLAVPTYCVTLDIRSNRYYYFWINAADGSLVSVQCSTADWMDAENMAEDKVTGQISAARQDAEAFLANQRNLHEDYKEVYCRYTVVNGTISGNRIGFYFIKEDGSAHWVRYFCDPRDYTRSLAEYRLTSYDEYLEKLETAIDDAKVVCIPLEN